MELLHRLVLPETDDLLDRLNQQKVTFKSANGLVELYLSDELLLASRWLKENVIVDEVKKKYTQEELLAAQWLCIRPSWQQFCAANIEEAYFRPCTVCSANAVQVEDVVISADIKKIKRHFLKLPELDDLFVSAEMKKGLESSGLLGFSFRNIALRRKNVLADNLFQCVIENCLPPAIINDDLDCTLKEQCLGCKTEHTIRKQEMPLAMSGNVLSNAKLDIYKTYEYFGQRVLQRKIVVSGRFYKYLVDIQQTQSIIVDDVVVVSL